MLFSIFYSYCQYVFRIAVGLHSAADAHMLRPENALAVRKDCGNIPLTRRKPLLQKLAKLAGVNVSRGFYFISPQSVPQNNTTSYFITIRKVSC